LEVLPQDPAHMSRGEFFSLLFAIAGLGSAVAMVIYLLLTAPR
jgi:hypothetical protein